MLTRRQAVLSLGAVAAGTALGPWAAKAQQVLTLNSITPQTHFFSNVIMAEWQRRVAEATDGEVVVEATAAPLGPMPRALDMVRTGVADISPGNHGTIANRFPLTLVTETPFLESDPERVAAALWRVHQEHLAAADEHEGVELLSLWVSGGFQFFSRKPLTRFEDLAGQKIITSSAVAGRILQEFGGTPVSAPVSEQYELLSRGVVDGTMTSHTGVTGWNLTNEINYELRVPGGLHYQTFYLVMNPAKWAAILPEHQEAIGAVSGESFGRFAAAVFAEEGDRSAAQIAENAEVTVVGPDEMAVLRERLAFVDEEWIAAADERGIDGAAALQMLRTEAAAAS